MGSFLRFLPELGWQPTVVSAAESVRYGKDYSLLNFVPSGIEVHRVGHPEPSGIWQYARNKLGIALYFPDYYKSWRAPALREARTLLHERQFDLIFSSSAPYTGHFIAMKLREEFNIPWVAEFEDPWSGNDYGNLAYDEILLKPLRKLRKGLIKRGERDILEAADRMIVVSWHHKQQLCELHGVKDEKIRIINIGYDESDFTQLKPRALYPDKLTVVFIGGSYFGYQEIAPEFLKVVSQIDENAEVVFIGRAAQIQEIDMTNSTRVLHVTNEKALAFASGGDFFLLITLPSAKWHIPMKLYDYLRLGKPVLAIVPEDGDAARIIKEAKAGFILSYEPEEMKRQLKSIFEEWRQGKLKDFHPDREYVAQFERRKLVQRLAAIFDEVAVQRGD